MNELDKIEFDRRVTRRQSGEPNLDGKCVVYWMRRAQRAYDSPALNAAITVGNLLHKPVLVFFHLVPRSHHANLRHYHFLVQGLRDISAGLEARSVGFVLRVFPEPGILPFCAEINPCLLISDEDPLTDAERSRVKVSQKVRVPFWTVEADVIIPSRLLGKEHFAARTIRPRIQKLLPEFLRPITNPMAKVSWKRSRDFSQRNIDGLLNGFPIDRSVEPVSSITGGSKPAVQRLKEFISSELNGYAKNRNKPDLAGTSRLSPYLHFGHLGPHTTALAVKESDAPAADRRAFLEELIVRRELAVNFVRFNPNYESLDAAELWADRTLRVHSSDARKYIYNENQLDAAETHDPLWNAAHKQMVLTGWMHGYLRMYWAKKILEWSPSPPEAYDIAVRLNDRYELDGRDPNGYAGIAWAIAGKHDRAWGPERPIYGKVRYMSYESTSRKFNSKAYIDRIHDLERQRSLDL